MREAGDPVARAARRKLAGLARDERAAFVIVNVAVNLLLLVRSYVTMQVLDYRALGLAALLQSILLLCGAMQFGFLNGGYRLLCSAQGEEAERINNLVFTVIGALALAFLAVALLASGPLGDADLRLVAWLGAVGGGATLARSWLMNRMVARAELSRLNRVNMVSSLLSLACLLAIPFDPLIACLAAVVAQPIAFALLAALADRGLLPKGVEFGGDLARAVLAAGFSLFVLNLLLQGNLQLERWYVTASLGLEDLGRLYLAFLFATLFQMVPTSLDQIFLPPAVRARDAGDVAELRLQLRQFLVAAASYCAAVALALVLLAEPLTRLLLPGYVQDLRWVYILAPGLIAFALAGPFGIAFNILIRYRWFLIAYGLGTAVTAAVFGLAWLLGFQLDLDHVSALRSGVHVLMALVVLAGWWRISRRHEEFRFLRGSLEERR